MLSLSVNASCLVPPNPVSKPVPPLLRVKVMFLVPPSLSPLALLKMVFETIPGEKLSGFGEDAGLLVPVKSLSVLPDWLEILMLYVPASLSGLTVPELKLVALV